MTEFQRPDETSPLHGAEEAERPTPVSARGSDDPRIKHLERVPLFSGFSEEELRRVAHISRIMEVAAGTVLTEMGKPGDSFFIIIDGKVSVHTPIGGADPLQSGDFFGEMSLLDGEPRSATITATTDVRLLVVERFHFWRLLDETPDITRRILTILSRRVRRLEQAANGILGGVSRV